MIAAVETSDTKMPSESQAEQIRMYREKAAALDTEIEELSEVVEANNRAIEASKRIRRQLAGNTPGVDIDDDGIVYREFNQYVYDTMISRKTQACQRIAKQWGCTDEDVQAASGAAADGEAHAGEHAVVERRRPHAGSAHRADLPGDRHQPADLHERDPHRVGAGHADVPEDHAAAGRRRAGLGEDRGRQHRHGRRDGIHERVSTYLGGGDLSWQAINWSTPDALGLWFDLVAADYALKTETDAGTVVTDAGALNVIGTKLDGSDTYDDWVAAIMDGAAEVYANSGRMADTLYLAPDQFYAFVGADPGHVRAAFIERPGQRSGSDRRLRRYQPRRLQRPRRRRRGRR